MPDLMVLFTNALYKVDKIVTADDTILRRALCYILMPFLKVATVAECARELGVPKDNLYRTLEAGNQQAWLGVLRTLSYNRVFAIIKSYCNSYNAKRHRFRITIGCDDSGFIKTGKVMPMVGLMWDHLTRRVAPGTQALYFYIIVGNHKMQFPLDLRLHRGRGGKGRPGRPSKKKTAMVVEMLEDFHRCGVAAGVDLDRVVFTADSWFVSNQIFRMCRSMGIAVVMKGKSNLVFTIGDRKISGGQLCTQDHVWRTYAGRHGYRYARYMGLSPTLGTVVLTVCQEANRIYYLIGSCEQHTSPKMIDDYKLRWSVEVFFRDSKQVLFLGQFRFRSRVKIIAHFVLRAISFHFADWIRYRKFRGRKTIGECSEYLRNNVFTKLHNSKNNLGVHPVTDEFLMFMKGLA